jgi:tRNA A-37 threonylcarbamoyl transferase component Bud32
MQRHYLAFSAAASNALAIAHIGLREVITDLTHGGTGLAIDSSGTIVGLGFVARGVVGAESPDTVVLQKVARRDREAMPPKHSAFLDFRSLLKAQARGDSWPASVVRALAGSSEAAGAMRPLDVVRSPKPTGSLPRHFLSFPETLGPWAKQLGLGDDWPTAVMKDLVPSRDAPLRYSAWDGGGVPTIVLAGERFWCRARRHIRCADSLFVFAVGAHGAADQAPIGEFWAKWAIWSRDVRGDRIKLPDLPETPTPDSVRLMESIFAADDGMWFPRLTARGTATSAEADSALADVARKYFLFFETQPGRGSSADVETFFIALNRCAKKIPGQLRDFLLRLLAVPPPEPVFAWLRRCWAMAAAGAERFRRLTLIAPTQASVPSSPVGPPPPRTVGAGTAAEKPIEAEPPPTGATHDVEAPQDAASLVRERLADLFRRDLEITATDAAAEVDAAVTRWVAMRDRWPDMQRWIAGAATWADAVDMIALLSDHEGVMVLPEAAWRWLAPSASAFEEAVCSALVHEETRREARDAMAWAKSLGREERGRLQAFERGDGSGAVLDALRSHVEAGDRVAAATTSSASLAAEIGPWAMRFAAPSVELAAGDMEQSLRLLRDDLTALRRRCKSHIAGEIDDCIAACETLKIAHDRVRDIATAFDNLGTDLDDYSSLAAMLKHGGAPAVPLAGPKVKIQHCLSNPNVRAAPLYLRLDDANILVTDIPVALRCEMPFPIDTVLKARKAPAHLGGRPLVFPTLHVRIRAEDWTPSDKEFVHTVVIPNVPIAPPRSDDSLVRADGHTITVIEIELALEGHDGESVLRFDELVRADFRGRLFEPFGDETTPDDMKEHPLGLQSKHEALAKQLRAGKGSLLVAAPRRFGKTTLLKYLFEALRGSDVLLVPFVTAGIAHGNERVAPEDTVHAAFVEACERLARALDMQIDTTRWGGDLPAADTFDKARDKASAQGKRAIYLVFDEAQALFSGRRGRLVAETLKARLETSWGVGTGTRVPVRIALFGQLHLLRQIKGQVDALFLEHTDRINEEEIRGFLAKQASAVLSTSDARKYIADVARNFMVLRALLEELETTLQAERRAWFTRHDVDAAISSLVSQALEVQDARLRTYLRDPLNGCDDLTKWRPVNAYPVAVAWANSLAQATRSRPARIDLVQQQIDVWQAAFLSDGGGMRVLRDRIELALDELRDLGVLRRDETFTSTLLERLLRETAQSKLPFDDSEERRALQSLSVDEVSFPEKAEHVAKGGEADVWQIMEPRVMAIRETKLDSERARSAFIQTCRTLKAIEGTRSRDIGHLSLPCVRQAGLRSDDANRGLVIYDWINGEDLVSAKATMDDAVVAEIGLCLAEALVVLDRAEIIHRDIKPENVVMGEKGRPVLIDFGLARLWDAAGMTRVSSRPEFLAPEVNCPEPKWSSKSDVFAVGQLMHWLRLASSGRAPALAKVIAQACAADRDERSSPRQLADALTGLSQELGWASRRQHLLDEARTSARSHTSGGLGGLALEFCEDVAAGRGGWLRPLLFTQVLASFLDSAFARYYDALPQREKRIPFPFHLTKAYDAGLFAWGKEPSISIAGRLRHSASHRESVRALLQAREQSRSAIGSDDDAALRAHVVKAAELVGRALAQPGLGLLIETWAQGAG